MTVGRLRAKLVGFLLVVGLLVALTLVQGNTPLLGLDLQGGISVVLEPVGKYKAESIDVAVDIIRSRVDSLGVAEPEINREGDNIVVNLPGVENRDKARRLVGQTAELRFRPVLALLPAEGEALPGTTTTTAPDATTTTTVGDDAATTTTAPDGTTTTTTGDAATTTTTAVAADQSPAELVASCDLAGVLALSKVPSTTRADDDRDACVVLPLRATDEEPEPLRLLLGPSALTGGDVDEAQRSFRTGQGYVVEMTLTGDGLSRFNALAAQSFGQPSPQDQVAIVLDGVVQSNPAFQSPSFSGTVEISGSFQADEAADLAQLINYGALPVQLDELTAENVSPTLGKDQLRAGIIAGVVGLLLVSIYMLVYYRVLGLVVIVGMLIASGLLFAVITTFLGEVLLDFLAVFSGGGGGGQPVLTLAGVTGLIVSIGVTVDSYIVYFERLKDEVRSGRTIRTSTDRGFILRDSQHRITGGSFRTIVTADLVSFLGAAILFIFAVGSVRGFAFFLGLSTLLDLAVSYYFMHPLVSLLSRRPGIVRHRLFGIAAGLDAREATA